MPGISIIAQISLRLSLATTFALWSLALVGCTSGEAPEQGPVGAPAVVAARPAAPEALPPAPARPRYRGLWVLCEGSHRTLDDPERVRALIETAQTLGVTDLFVQVYRGGRAWFDSSLADPAPYRGIVAKWGEDPLRSLVADAHAAGLRVHAWVNVLSLSSNRDALLLAQLGSDAVHVDRRGRSVLDYPRLELPEPDLSWYRVGTRGVYLDPAAPGVAEALTAVFSELVTRYPELDGLHLDYIRHPGVLPFAPGSRFDLGIDYGYGKASQERFRRETGLSGPFRDASSPATSKLVNANAWDAWRRDKLTELVVRIGEETSAAREGLLLSAAVISYVDRAYLSLSQDWRRWLEDGLIDFAVPMIYTRDDRLFRYQVEAFGSSANADRVWAGVGVWLYAKQPERALGQIAAARASGVAGDVLFSYDAMVDAADAAEESSLLRTIARETPGGG
jgi:uncharacterized lipoprotein YddW (UPF0748 family)